MAQTLPYNCSIVRSVGTSSHTHAHLRFAGRLRLGVNDAVAVTAREPVRHHTDGERYVVRGIGRNWNAQGGRREGMYVVDH